MRTYARAPARARENIFFAFLAELGHLKHKFFFSFFGHFTLKTLRIFSEFSTLVSLTDLAVRHLLFNFMKDTKKIKFESYDKSFFHGVLVFFLS